MDSDQLLEIGRIGKPHGLRGELIVALTSNVDERIKTGTEIYLKSNDETIEKNTVYSNHRRSTIQDIYAAEVDYRGMLDGWFVPTMPDLNQRNKFMSEYLIQNSIWWIETLNLSGIRQDTYPYAEKEFMSDWAGRIMKEYPKFNIVGEEWSYNPIRIAYWQEGNNNKDGYKSNLKSTMDFAMQKAISEGILEEENWNTGLIKIYENLLDGSEHFVLLKGQIKKNAVPRVRVISSNVIKNYLISQKLPNSFNKTLNYFKKFNNCVLIFIKDTNLNSVTQTLKSFRNKGFKKKGKDNLIRNYGIGAQIIKDLKIKKMILITRTPKKVIGLEGYNIKITKQELI